MADQSAALDIIVALLLNGRSFSLREDNKGGLSVLEVGKGLEQEN